MCCICCFALYKVHTDQLSVLSLRLCKPYNSYPLVSTDANVKLQGCMPFTHVVDSAGLSRQCSKGLQDSLLELSRGDLRQRSRPQGVKGSYMNLPYKNLVSQPSTNKVLKVAQTWPGAILYGSSSDFLNHNIQYRGWQ